MDDRYLKIFKNSLDKCIFRVYNNMKDRILKIKRKLIRANHHFFEDQLEWLEENKAKTGETAAALLRRLLDEYKKKMD